MTVRWTYGDVVWVDSGTHWSYGEVYIRLAPKLIRLRISRIVGGTRSRQKYVTK